ncbi:DUF6082 family protein [Nonomuraea sp. NBC_00507]|uniref:DUF6082 family protein n=1 Tax=Nonomuraea sp. NBC_00507 TaxID=2976002 RepID=UPI002E19EBCA
MVVLLQIPMVLGRFAHAAPGWDWAFLSDVGEAFAPVGSLLTALSLLGVAFSLFTQGRAVRVANEQAAKALHYEIMRQGMDEPRLLRALGTIRAVRTTIRASGTAFTSTSTSRSGVRCSSWVKACAVGGGRRRHRHPPSPLD